MNNKSKKYVILLMVILILSSCTNKENVNIDEKTSSGVDNVINNEENKTSLEDNNEKANSGVEDNVAEETLNMINNELEDIKTEDVKNENTKTEKNKEKSGADLKNIKLEQSYISPGGKNDATFKIVTNGDNVLFVSAQITKMNENDKKSDFFVGEFNKNINSTISGMTLEELKNIDVVGGASLTTGAFKEALKNM